MRFTFINKGTPFSFRGDKMTKHPDGKRGVTMLKVHAELVLEAMNDGKHDVYLTDENGSMLDKRTLRHCAKTGACPVESA